MNVQQILQAMRSGELSAEQAKASLEKAKNQVANKPQQQKTQQQNTQSIAIIGMAGRYPQAPDLETYWRNLAEGKDCVTVIPKRRWDVEAYYDPTPPFANKLYCKWLGSLSDIECFDPLFFGISPAEGEMMDPQHRIFLEQSYAALENAGYAGVAMSNTRCGVYFGIMNNEYSDMMATHSEGVPSVTGTNDAIGAARISYYLNLKGPAIPINTACSSSLVATHLACQALRCGEVDMALVGGVTLYFSSSSYAGMCAAGMLSPEGRSKAFDNTADGFVPGEGAGVVVLKRLKEAEEAGDNIYATIIGSGINQDGKTNGITAPSKNSQIALQTEVYQRFDINPDSISYAEMHGTGTKLGDPIELGALSHSFKKWTTREQYCAIGSVKSNIGHASAAAGVASMHKVILSMQQQTLVPTLHFNTPNQHFNFAKSPFYVNTECKPWQVEDNSPRRATVSSFGFSGTNAHLVMEEYISASSSDLSDRDMTNNAQTGPHLFILSAASEQALKDYAQKMLSYVELRAKRCIEDNLPVDNDIELANLICTLQVGRAAREYRLAFRVLNFTHLGRGLQHFLSADSHENGPILYGIEGEQRQEVEAFDDRPDNKETQLKWFEQKNWQELGQWWVKGANINWLLLNKNTTACKVPLPTYPFQWQQLWLIHVGDDAIITDEKMNASATISQNVGQSSGNGVDNQPLLTPLVHRKRFSSGRSVGYRSEFDGNEFYLRGHQVQGQSLLPAAACVEIAYAAATLEMEPESEQGYLQLNQTQWLRPIMAANTNNQANNDVNSQAISLDIELEALSDSNAGKQLGKKWQFIITTGSDKTLNCQGAIEWLAQAKPAPVDIKDLQQNLTPLIEADDLYNLLAHSGFSYGDANRGIVSLWGGEGQSLAKLALPTHATTAANSEQFTLHPTMLDGALQATLGVSMAAAMQNDGNSNTSPGLPFALEKMNIYGPSTSNMWSWVRLTSSNEQLLKYDIELYNDDGSSVASISGFCCKSPQLPAKQSLEQGGDQSGSNSKLQLLAPLWLPISGSVSVANKALESTSKAETVTLIVFDNEYPQLFTQLSDYYPDAVYLHWSQLSEQQLLTDASNNSLADSITTIVWLAVESFSDEKATASIEVNHSQAFFTLVKALLSQGYDTRSLNWQIFTFNCVAVMNNDKADAAGSSLIGLAGSMAKEHIRWQVNFRDVTTPSDIPMALNTHFDDVPSGEPMALRHQQFYAQQLSAVAIEPQPISGFKNSGLYVLIGGAGGIGEVLTDYLVKDFAADVVWIGRRALDEDIKAQLARYEQDKVSYISADCTSVDALKTALDTITERYCIGESKTRNINGVVHSAIVLQDQSLAQMTDEQFEGSLRAKVDISIAMVEVFGHLPLDFMLFFSSMQSFTRAAGQSNYAAGCTFKDTFANQISGKLNTAIKVMNWGYWGSIGIVSTPEHRARMAQFGIDSIEPDEAIKSLESLLHSQMGQMGLLKVTDASVLDGICSSEQLTVAPATTVASIDALRAFEFGTAMEPPAPPGDEIKQQLLQLLWLQLVESCRSGTLEQLRQRLNEEHIGWLASSLVELENLGFIDNSQQVTNLQQPKPDEARKCWDKWHNDRALMEQEGSFDATLALIESTLKALPQILNGELAATDIMFKDSSMGSVEGVYKGNVVADWYNTVLAESLIAHINNLPAQSGGLRILEIGAGTGGTSALLFERLRENNVNVEEYCYTDISRAFLLHGEQHYAKDNPYIRCEIFNVESPLADQPIIPASYDVVVATNVLHATSDIRRTIRNAKATLKQGGIMLINEISQWSLFAHLTFGLLKGWWLFDDKALRIPGCPALSPKCWDEVLRGEGFDDILFPAKRGHSGGQQIVVAQSDGIVRQTKVVADGEDIQDSEVLTPSTAARPAQPHSQSSVAPQKAPSGATDLSGRVTQLIQGMVSEVFKIPPEQIDTRISLEKYGMDSILAVQLTSALSFVLPDISSTVFIEYQKIDDLVTHLLETHKQPLSEHFAAKGEISLEPLKDSLEPVKASTELEDSPEPIQASPEPAKGNDQSPKVNDIAIISMAGRFPSANTPEQLWQILAEGQDGLTTVPDSRWCHDDYFDEEKGRLGKTYCRFGGFMDGVDEFDSELFGFTPIQAQMTDPQVRLFLQTVWQTMESAGYTHDSLEAQTDGQVGVYAGAMYQQYPMFDTDYVTHAGLSLSSYSAIVNRVSNFFGFKGPSIAIDTQCSSAMIAVHSACRSLISQECKVAIAGGVNLIIHPKKYIGLSIPLMLGSHQACRSFADGDGFLPCEGVGAVMLKPLEQAQIDKDPILAVIKSTVQSHAGRGIGYGSQDPGAQFELIDNNLHQAGVDVHTITCIEAAANGTKVSDSYEAAALKRAFAKRTDDKAFCAIGTVKSNYGHPESASGIMQLIKVLLQIKHRQIAPMIYLDKLNPNVDFSDSAFYLQTELSDWPRPVLDTLGRAMDAASSEQTEYPRRALINSFGGGGSLASAIIEEYIPPHQTTNLVTDEGEQLLLFSAQSDDQLMAQVKQMHSFVELCISDEDVKDNRENLRLADMALTLQIGREAMAHRVAFVVSSLDELCDKLAAYLDKAQSESLDNAKSQVLSGMFSGVVEGFHTTVEHKSEQNIAQLIADKALSILAEYWVGGGRVPWPALHQDTDSVRVALPTYPFKKQKCWLSESEDTSYQSSIAAIDKSFDAIDISDKDIEQVIVEEVALVLGLQSVDLNLDDKLADFELPDVLMPRLLHYLESRLSLSFDQEQFYQCVSVRDIASLTEDAVCEGEE